MKLKKFTSVFLVVVAMLFAIPSFATYDFTTATPNAINTSWALKFQGEPSIKALNPDMAKMSLDKFLSLTPTKYKELTGKKLGLKKSIQLKLAQKFLKKNTVKATELSKGVYVLLAILGLGWLAMGLVSDWEGSDWIISLVLYLLCYLPGLIYTLVKMKNYY
jgi:uncharacterized membrane protein YqaE (UPF0057 family)